MCNIVCFQEPILMIQETRCMVLPQTLHVHCVFELKESHSSALSGFKPPLMLSIDRRIKTVHAQTSSSPAKHRSWKGGSVLAHAFRPIPVCSLEDPNHAKSPAATTPFSRRPYVGHALAFAHYLGSRHARARARQLATKTCALAHTSVQATP